MPRLPTDVVCEEEEARPDVLEPCSPKRWEQYVVPEYLPGRGV
jgi:hypothetical protein